MLTGAPKLDPMRPRLGGGGAMTNRAGVVRCLKTGPGVGLFTGAPLLPFALPKPFPLTAPQIAPPTPVPVMDPEGASLGILALAGELAG